MLRTKLLILTVAMVAIVCVQAVWAYPPAGTDVISTSARVDLYDPGDTAVLLETVILTGRAVINRGNEYDPGDGRMKVNTVLDTLYLEGYSITYGDSMFVTLNRTAGPANGYIQQITAGIDYPAESNFDVKYQITLGPPAPNPPKTLGSVQGGFHFDDKSGQGELGFQLTAGGQSYSVPLTPTAPPKPLYEGPAPEVDPAKVRQGGDVLATATVIPGIPYVDSGSTVQYVDDYDEACPYTGSTSPDVVYSYQPTVDTFLFITLCTDTTDYDTKLYVYKNNASTLVDCNDDFCSTPLSDWVSELTCVPVTAGDTFYIVIDGYGGASGNYGILVDYCIPASPCTVFCPPNAFIENEPCGSDANGGCNMPTPTFEPIKCGDTVCGTGWADGATRDTDWYEFYLYGPTQITASGCAEFPLLIGFVDTADCALASSVSPSANGNPCDTVSATRVAGPGKYIMFVAPQSWLLNYPCGTDNDYWAALTCVPQAQVVLINPDTVHMADTIWSIPPHGRQYKDPRKVPVIDPVTGDTIAYVWHKHVVNPPDTGRDTIPTTGTMVVWLGPDPPGETQEPDDVIQLSGDAVITRGAPDPEGTIETEILSMDLTGYSDLFGPSILTLPQPAPGAAYPLTEETYPMLNEFFVDYQVFFPTLEQIIAPIQPPYMQAEIEALPPYNRKYEDPLSPHPVHDVQNPGVPIGWVRPIHWVRPQVGACCDLLTGACRETVAADCTAPNELFLGIGVPCVPNPCPQGPPPPPPADTIDVPTTGIMFVKQGPDPPASPDNWDEGIFVEGTATLGWGDPYPLPSGEWEYQTEIISMNLSGQSHLFGQADLSLPSPAPGQATSVSPGNAFPMQSSFDVDYIVDFVDIPMSIRPQSDPPHMQEEIDTIPPDSNRYDPVPEWHPIEDAQAPGPIIGWVRPIHFVNRSCCNTDGIRGDVNYDGNLNVADLTYMVNYLFRGGPPPPCPPEADVNGDGFINVADLTYIVDYLFRGGPAPVPC